MPGSGTTAPMPPSEITRPFTGHRSSSTTSGRAPARIFCFSGAHAPYTPGPDWAISEPANMATAVQASAKAATIDVILFKVSPHSETGHHILCGPRYHYTLRHHDA